MTTDFELESDESTTSGCCHSAAEQSSTISHFRIRDPVTVTAQTACSMERAYMYPPRRETAAFWREFLGVDQVVPSSKPIGRLPERLLKMNGYSGGGLRALLDDPNFVSSLSERNGIITGSDYKQDSVKYKLSEPTYDASAALLAGGPTDIWSGIGFGTEGGDFLECMDLDEFLMESGLASLEALPPADQRSASQSPNQESSEPARSPQFLEDYPTEAPVNENSLSNPTTPSIPASPQEPEVQADDSDIEVGPARPPINMIKKRRFEKDGEGLDEASVIVVPGQDGFDPVTARFKPEELQPQPIIKKSRKILVPEASKDDKYWRRRNKNNVAAKRSREARRAKENQIIMRASFLEEENERLTAENQQLLMENERFQELLKKSGLVA